MKIEFIEDTLKFCIINVSRKNNSYEADVI